MATRNKKSINTLYKEQAAYFNKLRDEHESLKKENEQLTELLKNVLASWDKYMRGEIETFKKSELGEYWSPAASMVNSEVIAPVREFLKSKTN